MSTYTLEDGRTALLSNGIFDGVLEAAVAELRSDGLEGLGEWLLDQRCRVTGPGVGYLDVRELSPRAAFEFRSACLSALDTVQSGGDELGWLVPYLSLMRDMWASIERGEPPEALTDPQSRLDLKEAPHGFGRQGPGWTPADIAAWRERYRAWGDES